MEVSAQRNVKTDHSATLGLKDLGSYFIHFRLTFPLIFFCLLQEWSHINHFLFNFMLSLNIAPCIKDWYNDDHPFNRLYTTVTVKCCTLVSPVTVALFTGPSLSSEHVTQDPSVTRDSERYPGEGLGRESESSDSDTEEATGEKKESNGAIFKVDDWISLSGNQEVIMAYWISASLF